MDPFKIFTTMKNLLFLAPFIAAMAFFTNCTGQSNPKMTASASGSDRIEVLDFHSEHRCKTCLEIEGLTKKFLADNYAKEMDQGLLSFRLINADDNANAVIVKKYQAYGTTLIVSSVKNGKEEYTDLTNFAFMNHNKADKFTAGLKKDLDAALKRIRS
jgi:hypothetical protein